MKIEELKKRYPDVKFYELKLSPDIEQFRLSNSCIIISNPMLSCIIFKI